MKSPSAALHLVSLFGHTRTALVHIWSEEEEEVLSLPDADEEDKKKRHATDGRNEWVAARAREENDQHCSRDTTALRKECQTSRVQSGCVGCNTGNGEKLSISQACCLAQLCQAAA